MTGSSVGTTPIRLNQLAGAATDACNRPTRPSPGAFMEPTRFLNRLGKFALIPIGLLLLLGAAFAVWSTNAWLSRAVEVNGSVVEMVRVRDSDSTGYLFTPLVQFRTMDGRTIEFQSTLRTNPPTYRSGEAVSVLYDPDEPNSAAIRGFFSLWFMPMILAFIGTVFLAIGSAMVVISAKVAESFGQPATRA